MKLERLAYSQYENEPQAWKIVDCSFGDINLIVGKNAIGKTRTLNVIATLAKLFSGEQKLKRFEGHYQAEFTHQGLSISYILQAKLNDFICEKLTINDKVRIDRGSGGKGKIYAEALNGEIDFQTSTEEVAIFARRDTVQHPFLEEFYEWGRNLLHYNFGTPLGRTTLAARSEESGKAADIDLKQVEKVVEIFMLGEQEYGTAFKKAVLRDMAGIGYQLDEISVELHPNVRVPSNLPINLLGILVKEHDLPAKTPQLEISQGMFRALSILIQINYASLSGKPSCILIDDIGEGLDFERSSSLLKLLIEKAKAASIQLIMATNDRFIMNNVPLEHWIVLEREGSKSIHHNYRNSKEIFDQFELTGLSNFDFFSTGYYSQSKNGK